MKRNLVLFTLVIIAGFISLQCSVGTTREVDYTDEVSKDERSVETFKSISLSISADVYVKQGSPQKLVLEGPEKELSEIITEVDGSNLKIRTKLGHWNIHSKIKVYITMEEITAFTVSGSGSIITEGNIRCDFLKLAVSGSGSVAIDNLKAREIASAVSGSGSIRLSGVDSETISHKIGVSGSGDIYAEDLQTQNSDVAISGSGSCRVYVTKNLKAGVSGSGKVLYKGNPIVNASVSGSGKVSSI
jgi:hypothetical protein